MEYLNPEKKKEQIAQQQKNDNIHLRQVTGGLMIISILAAIFAPLSAFSKGFSILGPLAITCFLCSGILFLIIISNQVNGQTDKEYPSESEFDGNYDDNYDI